MSTVSATNINKEVLSSLANWKAEDDRNFNDLKAKAQSQGVSTADLAKMDLQHKIEQQKNLVDFITNIMRTMHDIAKAIIQNFRVG